MYIGIWLDGVLQHQIFDVFALTELEAAIFLEVEFQIEDAVDAHLGSSNVKSFVKSCDEFVTERLCSWYLSELAIVGVNEKDHLNDAVMFVIPDAGIR